MFTPPADDVKPIPVPDEIYTQCITDAARFFGIDAELVFTLFDNEGGKVGTFSRNTKEGANKRGNSSRLTQSFHFFMFEPIFSPVNALNQPI